MIGEAANGEIEERPGSDLVMDLTPLLDVLFMLLVFFLLTANAVPIALELDLPRESSSSAQPLRDDRLLAVTIRDDDEPWSVAERSFRSWDAARVHLLELHHQQPASPVVIAAARRAPLEHMVSVLAFLADERIPVVQVLLDAQPVADATGQIE
jgi:biopolymer transport protein ExbD